MMNENSITVMNVLNSYNPHFQKEFNHVEKIINITRPNRTIKILLIVLS